MAAFISGTPISNLISRDVIDSQAPAVSRYGVGHGQLTRRSVPDTAAGDKDVLRAPFPSQRHRIVDQSVKVISPE